MAKFSDYTPASPVSEDVPVSAGGNVPRQAFVPVGHTAKKLKMSVGNNQAGQGLPRQPVTRMSAPAPMAAPGGRSAMAVRTEGGSVSGGAPIQPEKGAKPVRNAFVSAPRR